MEYMYLDGFDIDVVQSVLVMQLINTCREQLLLSCNSNTSRDLCYIIYMYSNVKRMNQSIIIRNSLQISPLKYSITPISSSSRRDCPYPRLWDRAEWDGSYVDTTYIKTSVYMYLT